MAKTTHCKHGVYIDSRFSCAQCESELAEELEEFERERYGDERRAFFESYENAVNDCRKRYNHSR